MSFKCPSCGILYRHKRSLNHHIKTSHPSEALEQIAPSPFNDVGSLVCNVCKSESRFKSKLDFIQHLFAVHDVPECSNTFDTKVFDSIEEFRAWKTEMEQETGAFYVVARSAKRKDCQVWHYQCNRSGYYTPKGNGLRHLKTQGSRKISGYCPSGMKLKAGKDGKCTVLFTKKHWGHDMELQHLSLTAEERKRIANKIAAKVPLREILSEIRENISNPDDFKRLDLLTKKDLHNIKFCFNLSAEYMKHQCDALSVDAWVKEMQSLEADDCILYYKPQGKSCEAFAALAEDDFFLAIMTNAQASMLEKYGHDIVCMDGTHGTNGYDFQLVTLMVVDDLREGFPSAFLFSNRTATDTLAVFFSKIKERLGLKMPTPKVFMSDMEDSFYNAWIETMDGIPQHRLYCTWHVDKAWKHNLKKDVQTTEKKSEVYKTVRSLMEETDQSAFDHVFPLAVQQLLNDPQTRVFGEYFEVHCGKNTSLWAYCHRLRLGVNTNMYVESLHKCLKYFELDGLKTKRLDKGIFAVMRFLKNKIFDRIITIHKGKISSKIQNIRSRHTASLKMDSDKVYQTGEAWSVTSSNGTDMFTVSLYKEPCSCKLICEDCDACIHRFVCTCMDSLISCNMCKHTHLVLMKIRSMKTPASIGIHAADPDDEPPEPQLTIVVEEEARDLEKENLLAEVCDGKVRNKKNILQAMKQEVAALLKEVGTVVENATSVEEVVAAKKLVAPIPHAVAAVRENSGANIKFVPQENSNKRKDEPQQRFSNFSSTKKAKKKASQPISKPNSRLHIVATRSIAAWGIATRVISDLAVVNLVVVNQELLSFLKL